MVYKCPLCNYRAISLQSLKLHVQKKHSTDVCPICHKKSRNITGHFYLYAKMNRDPQHLLLYYLYARCQLTNKEKEAIEGLLR